MRLLDIIYDINTQLAIGNTIWDKLQIKRVLSLIVKVIANYILPIFLHRSNDSLNHGFQCPVIVSMTSFPSRIERVWMTIESIICQSCKPQAIILWLSREQFPHELADLPKQLIAQQRRGLTIRFVNDDIKSFKKFYYAFQEFKQSLILTIDDDLLIPSYFLKSIYDCKQNYPNDVIASFGFRYKWDMSIDYIRPTGTRIYPGDSGRDLFFGSGGGTLFDTSVITNMDKIEKIIELCPTADDIYLNALVRICGCGVAFHLNNPLLSVKHLNNITLVSHNGDIGNPESYNAFQLRTLISYFKSQSISNPFIV